jgi:glycosyltransferase involved in cell wall biosynthesis
MPVPHIAFIAPRIYPVLSGDDRRPFVGGAEVQQSLQMRALQKAGWRVSVLTQDHGQPAVLDCEGITVHRIPPAAGRGWPGLRFFHPRMSDHARLLRRINPDLVFVQTASEEVAFAAAYARWQRKPFVFSGASDMDFATGPLPGMPAQHVAAYRLALRVADAVVVQNTRQQQELVRWHPRAGHLIPNGYAEQGARHGAFDGPVLWAATVKPLKRPEHYVVLARRFPARRFVLVGGPAPTPEGAGWFEATARQAASVPNLSLVGHVPFHQVGVHFDGAAVFINTSDYEGLPNTFLQAWLRGIPTLSFVRPESAPGVSGTQACQGLDGPHGMAAALDRLLGDFGAWNTASEAATTHFHAHHTLDGSIRALVSVFEEVLARRRSGAGRLKPALGAADLGKGARP